MTIDNTMFWFSLFATVFSTLVFVLGIIADNVLIIAVCLFCAVGNGLLTVLRWRELHRDP